MKTNYTTRLARSLFLALAAAAALGSSGCQIAEGINDTIAYNDPVNDFVMGFRNSMWAQQAWHERKPMYLDQPFLHDFGDGFKAGYADVASGAGGCTPYLPPRKYWSWKFQTAEGQGRTNAWFAGYPHGAKAAEEDGANLWSEIQVSEELKHEYELGHEPPYQFPVTRYNAEECCPEPMPYEGQIVPIDGLPVEGAIEMAPVPGAEPRMLPPPVEIRRP